MQLKAGDEISAGPEMDMHVDVAQPCRSLLFLLQTPSQHAPCALDQEMPSDSGSPCTQGALWQQRP